MYESPAAGHENRYAKCMEYRSANIWYQNLFLDKGTALFVHENITAFPAQSSFGLRPAYGETLPGHEGSR